MCMDNFGIQEILNFFLFFFTKKILEAYKVIVQDLEQISVGNIEYCLNQILGQVISNIWMNLFYKTIYKDTYKLACKNAYRTACMENFGIREILRYLSFLPRKY